MSRHFRMDDQGIAMSRGLMFSLLFAGGSAVMGFACWGLAFQRGFPEMAVFMFGLWVVTFAVILLTVRHAGRRG